MSSRKKRPRAANRDPHPHVALTSATAEQSVPTASRVRGLSRPCLR